MDTNGKKPAYPRAKQILGSGEDYHEIPAETGLTKRELIAAMAMQGIVANSATDTVYEPTEVAKAAVEYADSLLTELQKQP